ncbi:MAG: hypothetical protein WC878_03445 [Candidatus Paceibacterota bacterium]
MREDEVILPEGRLERILEKKQNGVFLKEEELKTAMRLIDRAVPTDGGNCWICERQSKKRPAIFDTGLCKKHAHEALLKKNN